MKISIDSSARGWAGSGMVKVSPLTNDLWKTKSRMTLKEPFQTTSQSHGIMMIVSDTSKTNMWGFTQQPVSQRCDITSQSGVWSVNFNKLQMNTYKYMNSLILSSGLHLCLSFQLVCGPQRRYDIIISKCFLMSHDILHMTVFSS